MGILGETDAGFPEVRVHGGASKDDQLVYAIHALGGWEWFLSALASASAQCFETFS